MKDAVRNILDQVTNIGGLIDELRAQIGDSATEPSRDPSPINDDRLRELLVGLERIRNATEAAQATAMVAMGDEARQQDSAEFARTGLPARSYEEFVPDEIAVLLSCTKMTASGRYGMAVQAQRHALLTLGWQSGQLDARKVAVIADQVAPIFTVGDSASAEHIERLVAHAVEHASFHTPPQTREWLRRRVIAIDPEAAETRRQRAQLGRRVVITPAEDGMSELWAWLPSAQSRQIQEALTRAAHELGADDPRNMDQRRADLLIDWLLGRGTPPPVTFHVVATAETLAGRSDQPGWVPGIGPVTAQQVRELAATAESISLRTSPDTEEQSSETGYRPTKALERAIRLRDVTCRFPGCRRSALGQHSGTDLDHTVRWPDGPTSAGNLAVLCRRHHRLKHSGGWRVVLVGDGIMRWTTPTGRTYQSEPWEYADPITDPIPGTVNSIVGPDPPARE